MINSKLINYHGFIDKISAGFGSNFFPGYFRDGVDSSSVRDHLLALDLAPLKDKKIKSGVVYNITTNSLVGELEAGFRLEKWVSKSVPTIIYHHGAGETPYDYSFRGIFPEDEKKLKVNANLIVIRAPFHRSMEEFKEGIRTLDNVVAMLSASVCLIEELIKYFHKDKTRGTLVGGCSLGGFISNLHYIYYNSASVYTPIMAGLAMDDVFLNSLYTKAIDSGALKKSHKIKKILNFEEEFQKKDNKNVFPLLAIHDEIVRYERQRESYGNCSVAVMEKGHATGAISYDSMRNHILKHLP